MSQGLHVDNFTGVFSSQCIVFLDAEYSRIYLYQTPSRVAFPSVPGELAFGMFRQGLPRYHCLRPCREMHFQWKVRLLTGASPVMGLCPALLPITGQAALWRGAGLQVDRVAVGGRAFPILSLPTGPDSGRQPVGAWDGAWSLSAFTLCLGL